MGADVTPTLIQRKYEELGLEKGWTFLACDAGRLKDASVAIVGTNPGGGGPKDSDAYGELWSCPNNAFCKEPSHIQMQAKAWHAMLNVSEEATLCAQFIPFRSPDVARLGRQAEAIAFARDLWQWVLQTSPANVFLTMGRLPARHLAELLDARLIVQGLPTGWGKTTIKVWESAAGRRIVSMPHPSRYGLFGRKNDASKIAEESFRVATATT